MAYHRHIIRHFHKSDPFWLKVFVNIAAQIAITRIPFRVSRLTSDHLKAAKKNGERGDVFLVGQHHRMTNYFIPEIVTHSLLYLGEGKFVHSGYDGVGTTSLKELIDEYDDLMILRPKRITRKKIEEAITYAEEQIGIPYNFLYTPGTYHFYCTQLINNAFHHAGFRTGLANNSGRPKRSVKGVLGIQNPLHPAHFIKGNFDLVYSSEQKKA